MSYTKALLRTNPKITSNYKLLISDEGLFLNSINANDQISNNTFKNFKVGSNNNFGNDLSNFWKRGQIPSKLLFDVYQKTADNNVVKDFKDQYERVYSCGAERLLTKSVKDRLSIFAPLLAYKAIPSHFIIFKLKGLKDTDISPVDELVIGVQYLVTGDTGEIIHNSIHYQVGKLFTAVNTTFSSTGNAKVIIQDDNYELSFNNIDYLLKTSEILKVYDLQTGTVAGDYLNSIVNDKLYVDSSISVDFKKSEITYNGIDIESGVVTKKIENIKDAIKQITQIIDFDEYVTNGFERNSIVSNNLLNLEFAFDDPENNNFNRYFGLYFDEKITNIFEIDNLQTFKIQYGIDSVLKNLINNNYSVKIEDNNGVNIVPKNQNGYSFDATDLLNNGLFFYKNFNKKHFKLNQQKRLQSNSVDVADIFNFEDKLSLNGELLDKGKDNIIITVKKDFVTGDILYLAENGATFGVIIADHLPLYTGDYGAGKSYARYFYPYGTVRQIAQAMSGALNYVLKNSILKATFIEDKVIIFSKYKGKYGSQFTVWQNNSSYIISDSKLKGAAYNNGFRIKVKNQELIKVNEQSFVKTKLGYSKIEEIQPFIDSVLLNPITDFDRKKAYADLNDNSIIIVKDETSEIEILNGKIYCYNQAKIQEGIFSQIPIEDLDFDSSVSDYANSPSVEYRKYYGLNSGDLITFTGSNNKVKIKKRGALGNTINPIISYGFFVFNLGFFTVTETSIIEMAKNFANFINSAFPLTPNLVRATVKHDIITITLQDTLGAFGNYFSLVTPTVGPGTVLEYSPQFVDGNDGEEYVILQNGFQQAIINYDGFTYGTGGTWNSLPINSNFIAFTNKSFTIVNGNPIVVAKKYLTDNEISNFSGFNSLIYKPNNIANVLENKLQILKTSNTEYEYGEENSLEKNFYKNKVVPKISKWVRTESKDIRNNDYRLNLSLGFNEFNFSPSFTDKTPNPQYFTHEWYYLAKRPEFFTDKEFSQSEDYFLDNFDEKNYINKFEDYFQNYFTVDRYDDLKMDYQRRYSKFVKSGNDSEVFFKGVRLNFGGVDLTDYKFAVVMNYYKTEFLVRRDPVTIKFYKNDDHKNVTMVVEIVLDDYKVNPYMDSRLYGEYSYLYMMNDIKEYDQFTTSYFYGKKFNYPSIFGVTFPALNFRGIQINNVYRKKFSNDINTLEFDGEKIKLDYVLKENSSEDFGTLLGFNIPDNSAFSTSNNSLTNPNYVIGAKNIANVNGNLIKLQPNSFYGMVIGGIPVFANNNISVFNSFYQLKRLIWFQESGGRNAYNSIRELISFASIKGFIENKDKIVEFYNIKNGILNSADFDVYFIEKDLITKTKDDLIGSEFTIVQELNNTTSRRTVTTKVDKTTLLYRYSGDYQIKTKKIFNYRNFRIVRGWTLWNFTWNESIQYTWNDFDGKTIDIEDYFNSDTNMVIEDYKNTVIEYYHKKQANYNLLSTPNVLQLNQLTIERKDTSVLSDQFESNYFTDNENNDSVTVSGISNTKEIKAFLKTMLFNAQDNFLLTLLKYDVNSPSDNYATFTQDLKNITITIDIKKLIVDFYYPIIKNKILQYFLENQFSDLNSWIFSYVVENVFKLYENTSIKIYKKQNVESVSRINTTIDELELIGSGFLIDNRSKITKSDDTIIIVIRHDREVNYDINIKLKFEYI